MLRGARAGEGFCGKIRAVVCFVPRRAGRFYAAAIPAARLSTRMTEPERLPKSEAPQEIRVSQTEVQDVHAALVRMHLSAAEKVHAEEAALHLSAAGGVRATSLSAHQSALGMLEAEELLSQRSAIGFVRAEKASVAGYTGAVVAERAEVHYGMSAVTVGRDVHLEGARAVLLLGQNITGNVSTVLDSRSALIAGLTGGLFAGLLLLLGRALFGRK